MKNILAKKVMDTPDVMLVGTPVQLPSDLKSLVSTVFGTSGNTEEISGTYRVEVKSNDIIEGATLKKLVSNPSFSQIKAQGKGMYLIWFIKE
jgi:hypothetical protein